MGTVERPSTYILRKAWLLGQKMARKERRLRPDLRQARMYSSYSSFRQFHRYEAENAPGFGPWDEKLQLLIEREGNGRGVRIDNPPVWRAFYTVLGEPIRSVFWAAWEDAIRLQDLYDLAIARAQWSCVAGPATLRVANSAPVDDDETAALDAVLVGIVGTRGDAHDDQLCPMPENTKAAG